MPILLFIVFVDLVGFGIIIPLLPFYAEHFGASVLAVTLLMAVYSAMQFVAAPLLGAKGALLSVSCLVVPPASADPGYGEFFVVPGSDHVDVCKPRGRTDVRYTRLLAFLRECV